MAHGMKFIVCALLFAAPASAQSFNVNFAPSGAAPSPSYGGVGLPGHWNSMRGDHGVTVFNLTDIHGNATDVSLRQIGGLQVLTVNDPSTSGDHATLLDSYIVTFMANLETCLLFNNLENGEYEVTLYAWMPSQPTVFAITSCDEEPGVPHHVVGGAWTGAHEEFVTYARHMAVVVDGRLQTHSGVVPGHPAHLGAAMNGVQIRKLNACPADLDGDGAVGSSDLAILLGSWGGAGGDLDGDSSTGASDLALLLGSWGGC